MKEKLLVIVISNMLFVSPIYFISIINDVEISIQFYLFISFISTILMLIRSDVVKLKSKQIIYTLSFITLGGASFVIATQLFIKLDNIFRIKQNIYVLMESFGIDFLELFSHNIIIEPILIFLFSYGVFTLIFKVIIKIISLFKYYEYNSIYMFFINNIKAITSIMGTVLILFGILPSFALLVEWENSLDKEQIADLMKSFNLNIVGSFFVIIIPYTYLMNYRVKNKY